MSEPAPIQLRWRGRISGPFSHAEVLQKLEDREIGLWHEVGHGSEWTTLGEYLDQLDRDRAAAQPPALLAPAEEPPVAAKPQRVRVVAAPSDAPPPPVVQPVNSEPPPLVSRPAKSLKLFVVLGAVLGFTGAHNFYAGYRGTAIAQLVLAGLTFALGFGFFISWLWALIELVIVHTDARGVRMR